MTAEMVTCPACTADKRPDADTVATAASLVDHVADLPGIGVPDPSSGVAVNCWLWPSITEMPVGDSATDVTGGGVTVSRLVPEIEPLVAVMVADPGATALTRPPDETVATCAALLLQLNATPGTTAPLASFAVAVSCCVPPT